MQVIATKSIHIIIQEMMNLFHGNKFSPWEDFFVNPFGSYVISPNQLEYNIKLRPTGMIGSDFFQTVSTLSLLLIHKSSSIPVYSVYQVSFSPSTGDFFAHKPGWMVLFVFYQLYKLLLGLFVLGFSIFNMHFGHLL